MPEPWEGAWEPLAEGRHGLVLINKHHYSIIDGAKDRKPATSQPPAEAEAAALFRSLDAGGGKAAISPSEGGWILDLTPTISRNPWAEGVSLRMAARIDGDRAVFQDVRADATRGEEAAYRRASAPGTSPMAGAWEMLSERRNGLLLQTDTHYALVETSKDRPRPAGPSPQMSDAEVAQLYAGLSVQAGTYTISGSTMIRRPVVAHNPQLQGVDAAVEFKLEGDTLRRFLPRPDGSRVEVIWRRIG